ncbi:hypothetical protein, partial [Pseudomonas sichuanensis]|uniref:hypothetical protein n=1 Tax=Pseudomonas sichuanensis TaxID=2213015 RepID=UPI0036ECFFEA
SAARAAHRWQASSHICFGPIMPVRVPLPALVPTSIPRRTDKADSDDLAGVTGPKQMWELACQRCAARAALDLKYPTNLPPSPQLLPPQQQSPATFCLFFLQLPLYPPRRKLNRFTEYLSQPFPFDAPRLVALAVSSTIKR